MVALPKEVVSARLPQERIDQIEEIAREEKVDRSTVLDRALENYIREWRLRKAIGQYTEGSATLPRAAETAGLTVWEMIDALAKRNVPSQYDVEDLEEDLKAFRDD